MPSRLRTGQYVTWVNGVCYKTVLGIFFGNELRQAPHGQFGSLVIAETRTQDERTHAGKGYQGLQIAFQKQWQARLADQIWTAYVDVD